MIGLTGGLTARGEILFGKIQLGSARKILTRAEAGSGVTAHDAKEMTGAQQALALGTAVKKDRTVTLPVTLASVSAGKDYALTEVGVYAMDPDEGEILYLLYRLETPLQICAGAPESVRFYLRETMGEAEDVTVQGNGGLITEFDLEAMMGAPDGLAELDEAARLVQQQLPEPCLSMQLLWENASPDSGFPPQTLQMDLSGFNALLIEGVNAVSDTPPLYVRESFPVGQLGCLFGMKPCSQGDAQYAFGRLFTSSVDGVTFQGGGNVVGGTHYSSDQLAVPLKIYGLRGGVAQ